MKAMFRTCSLLLLCLVLSAGIAAAQGKQKPKSSAASPQTRLGEKPRWLEAEEEEGEEILKRLEFFQTRRAGGPGKRLAPDAYAKAVQQKQQLKRSLRERSIYSTTPAWQSVNNGGMKYTPSIYVSGRTSGIAADPTDPNILYAATAGGGLWKTTDGGLNWVPLTDELTTMASGAVAVDPANPQVVYWATGEQHYSLDSYFGDGVFKSTDGGATWNKVATTTFGSYFSQIAIDPTNTNIVYLAGANGLYKSTNAGGSWNSTPAGTGVNCVIMNPLNPYTLYISRGGSGTSVLRKSTNGGASWTTLSWPAGSAGRTQLAIAPSDTNVLYAGCDIAGTVGGLYRSTDAGVTWTRQNSTVDYMSAQAWYDNAITVNPGNASNVIVGGLDIYSSTDGGVSLTKRTNWTTTTPARYSHADVHSLTYFGSVLYATSDGGVYKSTDHGVNWSNLNATLNTLQYQGADYESNNPSVVSGGMQDNGKSKTTNSGGEVTQVWGGDGGYLVIDPAANNYYYSQYYNGDETTNGNLHRSSDNGISYTGIGPAGTGGLFYNPFELAPGDPNTMIYTEADVWKTTNVRTATILSGWTRIATAAVTGGDVSAIGISNTNTSKIYIGTSNGRILVTTNNGTNWTIRTGFNYVTDFAVDQANDNLAYATFGGAAMRIGKTTDGGLTWNDISGNLPAAALNSVVIRHASPRMIIAGGDVGVFASTNEGLVWTPLDNGMPMAAIFDLKYKEGPKKLLAATHGRGCWMLDLATLTFSSTPSILQFGEVYAGTTVNAPLMIHNNGASAVTVSSVTSDHPSLSVSPTFGTIAAGDSMEFTVTFAPLVKGEISATLSFINDGVTSPDAVPVTGYCLAGEFASGTPLLAFGKVRAGASRLDSVTVTNTGNTQLAITGISSTAPQFVPVSSAPDNIAAGASKTFYCLYQPDGLGSHDGALVFTTSTVAGSDTVPLSGIGAAATIHVDVFFDADGDGGTTGDRTVKAWHLRLYKDSVDAAALVEEAWTSSIDFNVLTAGTYIVAEVDSGNKWARIGSESLLDTFTVANGQVVTATFLNRYFGVTYAVASRWNLVSVAVTRSSSNLALNYPTAISSAFRFDTTLGYKEIFLANPGYGFWLKFPGAGSLTMFGNSIAAETMAVAAGWNLIGTISWPVTADAVIQSPPGNIQSMFWRFQDGYKPSGVLEPGYGYWVRVAESGTLELNHDAPGLLIAPKADLNNFNTITFRDAAGSTQTLYFGAASSGLSEEYFAMPPAAPEGAFDVRFSTQRAAAYTLGQVQDEPAQILVKGAVYPVTVEWTFAQKVHPHQLTDGAGKLSVMMDRLSGSIMIKDAGVKSLYLQPGAAAVPAEYALAQNYPNPFNPTTAIGYQLPEESNVRITIFNVAGQEIRTLANGIEDAGYKTAEWNGLDNNKNVVPSGLYFYRLDATSTAHPGRTFSKVMKMMMVK